MFLRNEANKSFACNKISGQEAPRDDVQPGLHQRGKRSSLLINLLAVEFKSVREGSAVGSRWDPLGENPRARRDGLEANGRILATAGRPKN